MLKPLHTEYQGRSIVLECTHKRSFPPPQAYGSTDEDIDNLWRQGAIGQNEYQLLKTWQEKCHLMVMGPRCLDCPLALKQNPRPGRPNVIETEPWLAAKERMRWEQMKTGKGFTKTAEAVSAPEIITLVDEPAQEEPKVAQPIARKFTEEEKIAAQAVIDAAEAPEEELPEEELPEEELPEEELPEEEAPEEEAPEEEAPEEEAPEEEAPEETKKSADIDDIISALSDD